MTCVLAGGVGAARFLAGLVRVVPPEQVTAVVNVADDLVLHGLHISPDLDTVTYTLADAIDPERGWGLAGETWNAMEALDRYGGETWFSLGDRDLATHLYRTHRLAQGATLGDVVTEVSDAWHLGVRLLPATEDLLRTMITLAPREGAEAAEVSFQEWFVGHRHAPAVESVRFEGAEAARPAPGVLAAIDRSPQVVIAPSNPIVSIDPVLAVGGVREAVAARREDVVAVSPIVAGRALKGPADRLLGDLGHDVSVVGVARLYAEVAATLVVDEADAALADEVEAQGVRCVVAPTVMHSPDAAAALAERVLACVP